jgi:hypothetical protein
MSFVAVAWLAIYLDEELAADLAPFGAGQPHCVIGIDQHQCACIRRYVRWRLLDVGPRSVPGSG